MPLLATTIFRHTLRTRTFGMIVRRTRVLYRTKLFHGLRTLAGHHFHRFRSRFRGIFRALITGMLHVPRGSFRLGLRLRIAGFVGFAHFVRRPTQYGLLRL